MDEDTMVVLCGCPVRHLLLVQFHALPFAFCVGLRRLAVPPLQTPSAQGGRLCIRYSSVVALNVFRLSLAQQFDGHGMVTTR